MALVGTPIVPSGAIRSSMTSTPGPNHRVLGSRSEGWTKPGNAAAASAACEPSPEPDPTLPPETDDAADLGEPTHAMHLHVPDPWTVELQQLSPGTGTGQRFVDADGRSERLRQTDVAEQLVGSERLLDVEQPGLVERAEVRLVSGPLVAAIGVDGERHAGALERSPDGAHRLRVPAGGDLDLDPAVAVGQCLVDPALERTE